MKLKRKRQISTMCLTVVTMFTLIIQSTGCAAQTQIGTSSGATANPEFEKIMLQKIKLIDSSFKPGAMVSLIADFERIAIAEKKEWLPWYYAGMCQLMSAFMQRDKSKIDAMADRADYFIAKADSLQKNNSEITCLKSMSKAARIMVDEQARGMKYGMESDQLLMEAKLQDPQNPRPYLLDAQSKMYTPEQYGGGKAKTLAALQEALKQYKTFKPLSSIHPNWGEDRVNEMMKELTKQ